MSEAPAVTFEEEEINLPQPPTAVLDFTPPEAEVAICPPAEPLPEVTLPVLDLTPHEVEVAVCPPAEALSEASAGIDGPSATFELTAGGAPVEIAGPSATLEFAPQVPEVPAAALSSLLDDLKLETEENSLIPDAEITAPSLSLSPLEVCPAMIHVEYI